MAIVRFDGYFTLGFASITGSYQTIGTILAHNWRAFRIVNNTDGDMIFSFNSITDNLFVPASTFVLYDISANCDASSSLNTDNLVFTLGTQFYIKQSTAPTRGAVYIEGIYAKGQ
jgi:hypothetical protein